MEANETLIVVELVPGGSQGIREVSLKCRTARGTAMRPALSPLQFKIRLLPVGISEYDPNNPVL